MPQRGPLLLLRHGESTANAQGLFTGVLDVPLTERGFDEARAAAQLLAAEGFQPDVVFVSALRRARQTAETVLDVLRHTVPLWPDWRLDERNYGALTGRTKRDVRVACGEALFRTWRRSVQTAPPPLTDAQFAALAHTMPFRVLPSAALARTESLADVMVRVRSFYAERVLPQLLAGSCVLIVGHGNSLRALCAELDGLTDAAIEALNIPTGQPLLYEFEDDTSHMSHRYLAPEKARTAAAVIAQEGGT